MVRPSRFNNPINPHDPTLQGPSNPSPAPHNPSTDPQAQATSSRPPQVPSSSTGITGPTSALTSFLKEQGIRARNVTRFTSLQQQASTSQNPIMEEELENGNHNHNKTDTESDSESEPDSDKLDDQPILKPKNKSNNPSNPPNRVASSSKLASSKPKEPAEIPDLKPKPGKYADRKPGLITTCAECGKRFTVTRYTIHAQGGQGQLCDSCAQEAKNNPSRPNHSDLPPPAKKRKTKKMQVLKQPWSENSIQTLQMACITVIARNTESIEALGHVGSVNLEKICQIVCKHRELTPSNLSLFIDAAHTELKLFDCIHLREPHLKSIASFLPRLEKLTLNLCGHMTGEVLETYAERLTQLRELELFGPYLIRKESWLRTFEIWNTARLVRRPTSEDEMSEDEQGGEQVELLQGPQITGFRLKQSPRFDIDVVRALVSTCKNLTSLRLNDIGLFNDQSLDVISQAGLYQLKDLAISNAGISNGATGEALTDTAVIRLFESVGSTVETLDVSQNKNLTDSILNAIATFFVRLSSLDINGLHLLTNKGVQDLFMNLKRLERPGLTYLNLCRCIRIANEAIFAILDHSAKSLKFLDLNSVDEIREQGLERLATEAVSLESLDVSFVREVDDFVIKSFLDHMKNLKTISVYGDNRVSDLCPSKKGVVIKGQERLIVVT